MTNKWDPQGYKRIQSAIGPKSDIARASPPQIGVNGHIAVQWDMGSVKEKSQIDARFSAWHAHRNKRDGYFALEEQ